MASGLTTAFTFLTRLPVRGRAADDTSDVAAAVPWFPLVGLVVGAAVGTVHVVLSEVVSAPLAAAVAVATGLMITGAFHEDGLGDMADGFGGGWTRAQRLEIMRDPRQGTYGVSAIVCSILIRVLALASLSGVDAIVVVAAVHLLARNIAGVGLVVGRSVREDGLVGSVQSQESGRSPEVGGRVAPAAAVAVGWSLLFGVCLFFSLGLGPAIVTFVAATLAGVSVLALARAKIGGVTGDVLGAVEQLAEIAALVAVAAFVSP